LETEEGSGNKMRLENCLDFGPRTGNIRGLYTGLGESLRGAARAQLKKAI
jgi:hypothetical protein